MSPDPKGLAGGPNDRLYVMNNPLKYTDPEGTNLKAAIGTFCVIVVVKKIVDTKVRQSRNEQCQAKFGVKDGEIGIKSELEKREEQNKECKQQTAEQTFIQNISDVVTGSVGK